MNSQQRVQKIAKVFYIFAKITYYCSMIGVVFCVLGSIFTGIFWNNPDFLRYLVQIEAGLNPKLALTYCICGAIECGVGIALYYYVVRLYEEELAIGSPFNKQVAEKTRKVSLLHIFLPICGNIVCGIVILCMGITSADVYGWSGIGVGIVYLILSFIFDYGADINLKNEVLESGDASDNTEELVAIKEQIESMIDKKSKPETKAKDIEKTIEVASTEEVAPQEIEKPKRAPRNSSTSAKSTTRKTTKKNQTLDEK